MSFRTIAYVRAQNAINALNNLTREMPKVVERTAKDIVDEVIETAKRYPAAPSGSRYVRTYNFQNSWQKLWSPSGVGGRYTIDNTAENRGRRYGVYVMGDGAGNNQADVHAGRWSLLKDIVDAAAPSRLRGEIDIAISKAGF